MRSPVSLRALLLAFVCVCAPVGVTSAHAQPDVAWLGVQERENLPERAAAALDAAIGSVLAQTLEPDISVETETPQSPRAKRALTELDFLGVAPGDALRDRESRALGIMLGAKVTVRTWVEVMGAKTRVTVFSAAVNRRESVIDQVDGTAPPQETFDLAAWAGGIGGKVGRKVGASVGELLRWTPKDAAGFAVAAARFLDDGQPGIAALEFNRAITLAPAEPTYYLASARAYTALGDAQRARGRLRTAVALAPDMAQARLELGRAHLAAGDADAAAAELRRALDLGAGFDAHMALAAALENAGDLNGARQQYEQAANLRPGDTAATARASRVAAPLSAQTGAARPSQAQETEPEPDAARREVMLYYVGSGQPTEAVRQLRLLAEERGKPIGYGPKDYVTVARALDREFESIVVEARSGWDGLQRRSITPQQMTDAVRRLHERSDTLARAAEGIAAPPELERGHRHRVLAYNLLNQSDFCLLRYIEGRKDDDYDQSVIARQGAIAELRRAWDLDVDAGWPTRTAAEE